MTSLPSSSDFDLIVAIDFGTDGTALSFAIPNTKEVYIRQDWNEKNKHNKENFGVKMKTNILLKRVLKKKSKKFNDSKKHSNSEDTKRSEDEIVTKNDKYNYQFVAFGGEATLKYQNKKIYNESKDWLYFEGFKMALFEGKCTTNEKIKIRKFLKSKNGIKVKTSVVFIEAFKYIIRQVKLWVEKQNKVITLKNGLDNIQWIISVPAIWSDASKNLMIEWFYLGGIKKNKNIENQIKLEYEPDCASISVQNELREQSNSLSKGDRYILLDLGGGTADFACHEVLGFNEVCEINHPTGGAWGSTYIDKEFEKLLCDIFGKKSIDKFKKLHEGKYMTLLDNFVNRCKLKFFNGNFKKGTLKKKWDKKSTHNTELPTEFIDYLEDEDNIEDLEEYLKKYKYKNEKGLVRLHNETLSLNYKIWFNLFDICVNPIIEHLIELLENRIKNVKHLILVGGFSESKYVQYKIINRLGPNSSYKMNVLIPTRPLLCVVDGAARLGCCINYMTARKLGKTYGIKCSQYIDKAIKNGAPENYIQENTFTDYSGKKLVANSFYTFIKKNEAIKKGQKVKYGFTALTTNNRFTVYCSNSENPYTINQAQNLGYILIPKNISQGDNYDVEFYFGGTIIKVFVKDMKDKILSQTEIKYQI